MDFGPERKIRSIAVDTNVILDIAGYYAWLPTHKLEDLNEDGKRVYQRLRASLELVVLALAEDIHVKRVGLRMVEREILKDPSILALYRHAFPGAARPSPEIKRLAKLYVRKLDIPNPDAAILAEASFHGVDVLASWNRQHIVREETLRAIKEVNLARSLQTPVIITPSDFLSRITLSNTRTLCFRPSEVLPVYRLRISLPT